MQVVRKEIRKREEAEEFAVKAGRKDLVEQNRAERAILEAYVPAPLDADELERAIRELAGEPDGRDARRRDGGAARALRRAASTDARRARSRAASSPSRRRLATPWNSPSSPGSRRSWRS